VVGVVGGLWVAGFGCWGGFVLSCFGPLMVVGVVVCFGLGFFFLFFLVVLGFWVFGVLRFVGALGVRLCIFVGGVLLPCCFFRVFVGLSLLLGWFISF